MRRVIPPPTIIRDTREHDGHGYKFIKCDTCAGTVDEKLDYGDYAIKDHLDLVVVERKKSVAELCNNLGKHRERFERELQGMVDSGIKLRHLVIEDYWTSINRQRFTKMHPNAIFESLMAMATKYGLQVWMAGNAEWGHRITRSALLKAWKYRCEELL